jgi:hypothetical protein
MYNKDRVQLYLPTATNLLWFCCILPSLPPIECLIYEFLAVNRFAGCPRSSVRSSNVPVEMPKVTDITKKSQSNIDKKSFRMRKNRFFTDSSVFNTMAALTSSNCRLDVSLSCRNRSLSVCNVPTIRNAWLFEVSPCFHCTANSSSCCLYTVTSLRNRSSSSVACFNLTINKNPNKVSIDHHIRPCIQTFNNNTKRQVRIHSTVKVIRACIFIT